MGKINQGGNQSKGIYVEDVEGEAMSGVGHQ